MEVESAQLSGFLFESNEAALTLKLLEATAASDAFVLALTFFDLGEF